MDDVLTLTDHDIAAQRDRFRFEIIDTEVAARALILGEDGHAAAGFNAADILSAFGPAERGFSGCARSRLSARFADPNLLAIEDNEAAASHCGVALNHLHIAVKRCCLALVVNLESGGLDLNGGILVFKLPRFGRPGSGSSLGGACLCKGPRRRGDALGAERRRHDDRCELPRHGSLVLAASADARLPGSSVMATPLKRTALPPAPMSSRFGLRKPSSLFTHPGFSAPRMPC